MRETAALRASMELFDRATMSALRRKGDKLTSYLEWLLKESFEILTPRERGSMLTIRVPNARELVTRLAAHGAVVDFRPPDIVRITPAPLYNSFADVQRLAWLISSS